MFFAMRTAILAMLLLPAAAPSGGGIVQTLPEDGTWVNYHLNWKLFGPGAEDSEGTGSWMVRFVGTSLEKRQKCRWVEFVETLEASGFDPAETGYRFLVPEDRLHVGGSALAHAVAWWRKPAGEDEWTRYEGPAPEHYDHWRCLPGVPDRAKELGSNRRILFQFGELTCDSALRHTKRFRYLSRDVRVSYTIWPHKDVPCGAAAAKIERVWNNKDGDHHSTMVRELQLVDFGVDKKLVLTD